MTPLDGARLKVIRAQEHLDALKAEIGRYADTHPYTILAEEREKIWQIDVRITTQPPPRLSAIVGDCLGNLRATLDYIVWQLAIRYAERELVIGRDTPYFPMSDDPDGCRHGLSRLAQTYSIPASALREIENVQPYQAGYEILRLLRVAVNQDKHRLLLLTTSRVLDGELEIWPEGYTAPFRVRGRAAVFLETSIPTSGSAEPALVSRNVKVQGQATIFVTLKDFTMPREPVDVSLAKMIECVSDIVPRFDAFV